MVEVVGGLELASRLVWILDFPTSHQHTRGLSPHGTVGRGRSDAPPLSPGTLVEILSFATRCEVMHGCER